MVKNKVATPARMPTIQLVRLLITPLSVGLPPAAHTSPRGSPRRPRRDLTARDAHDHARARQAADEEARGAGVTLLGLYVTVTVTDPGLLSRATADTEASAETSKIRLQRL